MRRLTEDFFYYWAGPDNPNDQNNQFLLWDCEQTGITWGCQTKTWSGSPEYYHFGLC